MSTVTLAAPAVGRRAINHWVVAIVVVVPTFMEILDTTVANVALRYIAGGLSAAQSDADWVITSYLAANAIILPITGWLATHLGRRNYFLLSIAGFTLASALCGLATSLWQMILFRVVQGLAGGGLQPCSQGRPLMEPSFPAEKQGTAMTLFAVAAIIAPIVGPTLGGWLCVDYNWRWIFLINVPIGLVSLAGAYFVVEDPDYLKKERAGLLSRPVNFDLIGLGVLALVMSCWEVMLSKGQEWDWLGDPFGRVQTLVLGFALGLGFLVFWEMRSKNPIINFRVLKDRNLSVSCVILFFAFAAAHAGRQHRPAGDAPVAVRLRRPPLRAGDVAVGGLVADRDGGRRGPDGAGGRRPLDGRPRPGPDGRRRLLDVSDEPANQPPGGDPAADGPDARPGAALLPDQRGGLPCIPPHLRGAAVGIASLLRTEGGSVGTSLASTIRSGASSSTQRGWGSSSTRSTRT